jgi:hypothetical protein
MGTDQNSQQQAVTTLYRTIFPDYQNRFSRSTFNRILTRCNIVKTCNNGSNQTTAYILRSACRSCFICQPTIEITLTNIPDENIRLKIQTNTSDFFKELYCASDQNASLPINRYLSTNHVNEVIKKLWDLAPFKYSNLKLSSQAIESKNGYDIDNISITFTNSDIHNEEITLSFDKNGNITDFSLTTPSPTIPKSLNQEMSKKMIKFLERLRTALIIKDSNVVIKSIIGSNLQNLSESQKNYLSLLRKGFKDKEYINYSFQEIEFCPLINDSTLYGISIHQKMIKKGIDADLGYLTLFLEEISKGNDLTLNSFKISTNKIDPCFP